MQDKPKARRRLLKAITITSSITALPLLPSTWTRPFLNSVALPAHAQTSDESRNAEFLGIEFGYTQAFTNDTFFEIVITENQNTIPVLELVETSIDQGRETAATGFEVRISNDQLLDLTEEDVCTSDVTTILQILAIQDGINQGGVTISSTNTSCFASPPATNRGGQALQVTGTLGTIFSAAIEFSVSELSPISIGVLPVTFMPVVN